MTLIATPGDAAADSYFTLVEATAYFTARGVTAWAAAASDTVREQMARKGTSYLDNAYRDRWIGMAAAQTQSLLWPRVDGYRDIYRSLTYPLQGPEGFPIEKTDIPVQVKTAAMEAALLALSGVTLEPQLVRGGQIKSIGKSVGPLRKDIVYTDGASVVDRYLAIEGLLRGLVTSMPGSSSGNVKLVRS